MLPIFFIVYYGSVSLFMHVHIENGVTIVHSHPFKKTDGGVHQHASFAEIQLFHLLTAVDAQDGAVHALDLQYYVTPDYRIVENPPCSDYLSPVRGKQSPRAPPFA